MADVGRSAVHEKLVLDTDIDDASSAAAAAVVGLGGDSTVSMDRDVQGAEEGRDTKDDDTANNAESGQNDDVVEDDDDTADSGRRGSHDVTIWETAVHHATRYGSLPNHPPSLVPLHWRGHGRPDHFLLLPLLLRQFHLRQLLRFP